MPGTTTAVHLLDGTVIADVVARADSFWSRFRGLMGRSELHPGEGLYLPGTSSIHMLFMRFPIDCLFVGAPTADGSRRVAAVRHSLPPWRGVVWYVRGAKGVVELPAGTLRQHGVDVGNFVRLEDGGR